MSKALIVYRVDRHDLSNLGVIKKLTGQVDGLQECGYEVDYVIHDRNHIYCNNKPIFNRNSIIPSALFKWSYYDHLLRSDLNGYDIYMTRFGLTTPSYLKWLQQIRSSNPGATIVIDMPTYPYAKEWSGWYGRLALYIDQIFRRSLSESVDYILHSGREKEIFGIPTVLFSNGIQVRELRLRRPKPHLGHRLLAIGKWQFWHGLDRLIKGLAQYIRDGGRDICLDVVGEGPELTAIKKMVKTYGLERVVSFKGVLSGSALDPLFDLADLGVGTLGLHRKGVSVDSSLKHREYIARGLPMILSGVDVDIASDEPFVHHVPSNEEEVDVSMLISYIKRSKKENLIVQRIRTYAEEHLSWKQKIESLINQIEGNE